MAEALSARNDIPRVIGLIALVLLVGHLRLIQPELTGLVSTLSSFENFGTEGLCKDFLGEPHGGNGVELTDIARLGII